MNILHIDSERSWRGGQQQIAYLAEELKKHGVNSCVVSKKKSALSGYCEQNHIPCYQLALSHEFDIFSALRIKKICAAQKTDLIHAHSSHAHSMAILSHNLGNPAPIILSRRVDYPIKKTFLARYKYNHKAIKKILCVSQRVKEVMESRIENPEKLKVVYSGIDIHKFKKRPRLRSLCTQYSIAPHSILIGNTAALDPQKDPMTFLKTARALIRREKPLDPIHFLMIGEGKMREQIKSYIHANSLDDRITLTGFREDIPIILPELDIFLFTPQEEALGTSILDAFAAGVAVVSTRTGGIPEMILHEETGLLAGVGDADQLAENTQALIDSSGLRKKLVEKARKRVEDFSKEKTARDTHSIYQQFLSSSTNSN